MPNPSEIERQYQESEAADQDFMEAMRAVAATKIDIARLERQLARKRLQLGEQEVVCEQLIIRIKLSEV